MFDDKIIKAMLEDAKSVCPEKWELIRDYFQKACFAISVDVVIKTFYLFQKKNDTETFESIDKKIGINEPAKYVFRRMLDILVEEDVLKEENGQYTCMDPDPDIWGGAEILVEAVRKIPEEGAAFQWLARGADGLYRFITGKISGEEAMFGPWSDFALVEDVYFTSKVYGFWSKLAGKVVQRLIDTQFENKISVLEIGAGTGNGTFELLRNVDKPEQKIEKYIFTDIYRRLVKKSSKKFTDYDFMEFKTLDVTKPLEEQDVQENSADLLFAVNVMHATNDILQACKTMATLVKDSGFVVLGEISPPKTGLYRYMELTFGLLSSYNQYDDKDLRPNSPILRPEQWINYFKKAGFKDAIAIPGDLIENSNTGGVIIAKK